MPWKYVGNTVSNDNAAAYVVILWKYVGNNITIILPPRGGNIMVMLLPTYFHNITSKRVVITWTFVGNNITIILPPLGGNIMVMLLPTKVHNITTYAVALSFETLSPTYFHGITIYVPSLRVDCPCEPGGSPHSSEPDCSVSK